MTMIDTMSSQNSIYNPDRKPLEEVKIKTLVDGQYMDIPALDKHWMVEEREFTLYSAPPSDGDALGLGAKEAWLERMGYLNADFRWLLHLEHHRFWSQIALDGGRAVGGVEQFLQEAHPLYATDSFPTTDDQMVQIYQEALHLAFLVMCRIICEKESDREWIRRETLAQLWYSKYIITLPMLFDMCLLYGDGNTKLLTKLVKTVFDIQPLYKDDLKNAVCFIGERLSLMQDKLNTRKVAEQHHPAKLFERDFNSKSELSLANLSDLILYLLDSMLNLATILFIYQPACPILHSLRFETKIVSFYEHTIPSINEQLAQLSKKDDTIDIYFDLKYKLDVVRVQMIKIFRNCLFSPINSMIELTNIRSKSADQIKVYIEDFISTLSEFLADKLFIQDYHKAYPVDQDLEILSQVYPDLDSLKCDFLMESVWSCYDVPPLPPAHNGGTSSTSQQQYLGPSKSAKTEAVRKPNSVELESLVTQVKDLLPHLGDGFIQKCLEHYRYDSATVINAVLESTLPDSLCSLDFNMPAEQLPAHTKNATNNLPLRVNVFDNDEFDIMTRDSIDTSRVHKGKWKMKYKNLNEMLDDKSHVAELKEQFTKLGFVEGEEDVYDDEYDDTYDGLDVSVGEAGEPERRQFVTPRVLENRTGAGGRGGRREEDVDSGGEEEEEDNEEEEDGGRANRDSFVENPEVVRARLERQRQNKYQSREGAGPPASSRNVTGKPKGQGQEKRVVENRDRKNTGKAYVGNHNRRNMTQRKRNQGMMPS